MVPGGWFSLETAPNFWQKERKRRHTHTHDERKENRPAGKKWLNRNRKERI
jgi:hypothetical protein